MQWNWLQKTYATFSRKSDLSHFHGSQGVKALTLLSQLPTDHDWDDINEFSRGFLREYGRGKCRTHMSQVWARRNAQGKSSKTSFVTTTRNNPIGSLWHPTSLYRHYLLKGMVSRECRWFLKKPHLNITGSMIAGHDWGKWQFQSYQHLTEYGSTLTHILLCYLQSINYANNLGKMLWKNAAKITNNEGDIKNKWESLLRYFRIGCVYNNTHNVFAVQDYE